MPRPRQTLLGGLSQRPRAARLADRRRPDGIGKATLAYRMARFVLAPSRSEGARGAERDCRSRVPAEHPVARRIAGRRPQRSAGAGARRSTRRPASCSPRPASSEVRRTRVVLRLDRGRGRLARRHRRLPIEDLNRDGRQCAAQGAGGAAAAARCCCSVSRCAGRVLPTIRSRCRALVLRPLPMDEVAQAVARRAGRGAGAATKSAPRRPPSAARSAAR